VSEGKGLQPAGEDKLVFTPDNLPVSGTLFWYPVLVLACIDKYAHLL
jgi:hypothetical protein